MKLFTLEEANGLLPEITPKLQEIRRLYTRVDGFRDEATAAAVASEAGGGMQGGTTYVKTLYEVGKLTTELNDLGVELKDHTRGLIDFPSKRGSRVVYLCWEFDDGDEIGWWHETDGGYAGRQRL